MQAHDTIDGRALAIAKTNSINKAAEELLVGAPALSRAIKELENDLGVTLFDRSAKGMFLTPDGELFVQYAKKALKHVDDIEKLFKDGTTAKKQFSVSVPRASYIADAMAHFTKRVDKDSETELLYRETNDYRVIKNVTKEDCKLGVLRYSEQFDSYYRAMMEEKGLVSELITEFHYVVIMSKDSPLASLKKLTYKDLSDYTEIAHADPYVPSLQVSEVKKWELPEDGHSRIYIFERCSQFEILSQNTDTFMWVSHIPQPLLDRYGLVERKVPENKRVYKDVLIHHKDYRLSALDKMFIEELIAAKRRVFK